MSSGDPADSSSGPEIEAAFTRMERVLVQHLRSAANAAVARDRNLYQQVVSYLDLRAMLGIEGEIPPLRGFAISPDMGVFMLRLLRKLRPASILELGSGFSSVLLGHHCAKMAGHVVSLDHDPAYVARSTELIAAWGLGEQVETVLAPIENQRVRDSRAVPFYSAERVRATGRRFDFVFVDGPPLALGPRVRGGFLPLFGEFLEPGCHILLDDYYRKGEQEVVSNWVEQGLVEIVELHTELEKQAALLVYHGDGR